MFVYIGGGFTPANTRNCQIYVNYEKNPPRVDFDYDEKLGVTFVKCPDRTLALCRPNCKYRPIKSTWDEFLTYDLFKKATVGQDHIQWTLMSAHNVLAEKEGKDVGYFESDIQVMLDSGGAQLKIGTANYIDPKKIIDFYNKMKLPKPVYGAALDVPYRPADQGREDIIHLCALALKRNNRIFSEYTDGSAKLINVMHGHTLKTARMWLETVENPAFIGWAGSGGNLLSVYNNWITMLVPIIEGEKKEIYHIFGEGGRLKIPIMAWMGKYVPLLTSDSSTPIQEGMMRKYLFVDPQTDKLIKYKLGSRTVANPLTPLPCSCPVCSRIKYKDVFNLPTNTRVMRYLFWHNLWTSVAYSKIWVHFASQLSRKEYKQQITKSFGKEESEYIKHSIDFIAHSFKHGLDVTAKEYRHEIVNDSYRSGTLPVLFDNETKEKSRMGNLALMNSAIIDVLPYYFTLNEIKENTTEVDESLLIRKCKGCGKDKYRGSFKKTKVGKAFKERCYNCRTIGKGRKPKT